VSRPQPAGPAATAAAAGGGIGLGGALLVLFVGLKLAGIIDWSWWWVLSPVWIPLTACLLILLIGFGLWVAITGIEDRRPAGAARRQQHGPAHRWGRRG